MNPFTSGSCGVFDQWKLDVRMPFPRKYLNIIFLSLGGPNSLHLPARGQGLRFAGLAVENHQYAATESLEKSMVPLPQGELHIRFRRYVLLQP
jgi:hypothetical protein